MIQSAHPSEDKTVAFDGTALAVDRDMYLSQHDIVYRSPAVDGYDGFPLGNGDLGLMAWTPPDQLFFRINKTNTWDDAEPGLFGGWEDARNPDKSERFTSLRSCGELRIAPGIPVFDLFYLEDFEARLSLSTATATWHAKGPLGSVHCRAFVCRDPFVAAIEYSDELSEEVERSVVLARWGSRVFEHWYRFVRREFHLGFADPTVGLDDDEAWIVQPTRSLTFATAAKVVGNGVQVSQPNRREARFATPRTKAAELAIYVSVVTSEEAGDPASAARENVRIASGKGIDEIHSGHARSWADFWSKSFVHIPDTYFENLWYFNCYQVGSSSRGHYPPHFIGSIWSWNRDFRPWNHYFQWNQQQYTWPLHASGHPELMVPYARWRLESLPGAQHAAREAHECEGAFFADISDRRGNQAATEASVIRNIGASGLAAMDMLRHYEYTLDEDYLGTYCFPVLQEVVRFYSCKMEQAPDGVYHIPNATPNEGHIPSRDTTNDLAAVRKLFSAYIDLSDKCGDADPTLVTQATEILDHLAPYVLTEVPDNAIPWGDLEPGDVLMSYGMVLEYDAPGQPWMSRPYWAPDASLRRPHTYHAVNAQLAPVFPSGLVGVDDADTTVFEACKNAALSFDPVGNIGITPLPICLARLGLASYLPDVLGDWVDSYQLFSQGLFCYLKRDSNAEYEDKMAVDRYSNSEHNILGLTNEVSVIGSDPEERVELLRRPFAHVGLEAGSIFETTINEMLMQSYDGIIRVFPATPEEWDCTFTLHAVGAFVVTSERLDGTAAYVLIESGKGNRCTLRNPWPHEVARVSCLQDKNVLTATSARKIEFATTPGGRYLVERSRRPVSSFEHAPLTAQPNRTAKSFRRARLGIDRHF